MLRHEYSILTASGKKANFLQQQKIFDVSQMFIRTLRHKIKKKVAALSMLHKAKKAYYACDVIRTRTLFTRRQAVAIAT